MPQQSKPAEDAPAPLLAVTQGDPAGIGIEITAKAWRERQSASLDPFFLIGSAREIGAQLGALFPDIPIAEIDAPEAARAAFPRALPVVALDPELSAPHATIEAIRLGVQFCNKGAADAIVTNPIHKKRLYEAGFDHPGHTEYLAALTGRPGKSVMMLACTELKVVPATVHVPIRDVPDRLSRPLLRHVIGTTLADLRSRFGLEDPRLTVTGLNPHAGEGGSIGREEVEIIRPVVEEFAAQRVKITGPFPADSLFHAAARAQYDAVLCMYHDQALIPLKTIDFDGGVNVTLGLDLIRTSPDHGTADDIAGKGIANPSSLIAALRMAGEMARASRLHPHD